MSETQSNTRTRRNKLQIRGKIKAALRDWNGGNQEPNIERRFRIEDLSYVIGNKGTSKGVAKLWALCSCFDRMERTENYDIVKEYYLYIEGGLDIDAEDSKLIVDMVIPCNREEETLDDRLPPLPKWHKGSY